LKPGLPAAGGSSWAMGFICRIFWNTAGAKSRVGSRRRALRRLDGRERSRLRAMLPSQNRELGHPAIAALVLQYPSGAVQFEGIGAEKGDSNLGVFWVYENVIIDLLDWGYLCD